MSVVIATTGKTSVAVLPHAVATALMAARAQAAVAASSSLPFASVATSRSVVPLVLSTVAAPAAATFVPAIEELCIPRPS